MMFPEIYRRAVMALGADQPLVPPVSAVLPPHPRSEDEQRRLVKSWDTATLDARANSADDALEQQEGGMVTPAAPLVYNYVRMPLPTRVDIETAADAQGQNIDFRV